MKLVYYLFLLIAFSVPAFAQIGPLPCGAVSSITTWRQDFPYLIGQVVIFNGVTYQSLTNNNLNQNPCTYSGTQWSNIVGSGGGSSGLATYTAPGLTTQGKAYVSPTQITGPITDAFQAIDAAGLTLPSNGGTIDATGLGSSTYTVTHQLTALNQSGKPVTLLLNSGTKFIINTSFATPTDTPASCAVPVGPGDSADRGSAIIVPGFNAFGGNFILGPNARVWDAICNGDFTGNQETLRLDGVVVQGNSGATVMGSLMHFAGVFTPTHIDNSGTYQCFAQCLRLDAGTTGTGGSALGDISFSNDHFADTYGTGGTYPGSVVLMDALTSQGGLNNINFFGGMIEGNGPHNALLVINGRGSVQVSGIGFFGTTFQTASATPSGANPNVDPIQLIDVSQVLFTNLRVAGNQSTTGQPNLVDISTTTSAKVNYGINIDQIEAFTGDFTCLVHNSIESPATCDAGYPTGSGDTTMPYYTYGQVFPIVRLTNNAPAGACISSSIWGNSAGTTAATTNYQCINGSWVGFSSGGGGGSPAGSNMQVQFNNSGSFGADATFTFNNSSKTLFTQNVNISTLTPGFLVKNSSGLLVDASPANDYITPNAFNGMNPQGFPATSTQNYSSWNMWFQGNFWNGATGVGDFWSIQNLIGTGTNPSSTLFFGHNGVPAANTTANFGSIVVALTPPLGTNNTELSTTAWVYNNIGGLPAQFFGAFGDAYSQPDGCITTASSTVVLCNDGTFVSTDVGKQIWVQGAGAAGVAFHGAITSVVDSQHVVVTPAPSTSVSASVFNNVYGHDDTVAVQACLQYSANAGVQCVLRAVPIPVGGNAGQGGFLIGSAGLTLATSNISVGPNVTGSNYGTNLYCEFNGDCISLPAGPVTSALVSNLSIDGDPSQPNGRGIHLNAAAGTFGTGGLWNSTFNNVIVNSFAKECMLSEGGGGVGYGFTLPIQIDTFSQFQCNGPNQMHTTSLIKMTGQHAQIIFQNGQVNGNGPNAGNNSWTYYPNPLIDIEPFPTGAGAVTPVDVKFYGYTYEVGTQGLKVGDGAVDIHFDNGYVENVGTPLIAGGSNAVHLTYNGNHIANSGNITGVAQFTGNVTGGMRDNFEYGGAVTVTDIAVCTGTGNNVDFASNQTNNKTVNASTNCVTTAASSPSSSTLTVTGGQTVDVGASTIITTISSPGTNPGKTLILYASSSNGLALGTGGNINLGPFTGPLGVPQGGSITLTLFDAGTTWTVTGVTPTPNNANASCTAPTMTYRWVPAAACSTSQPCATDIVAGNNASQTTGGDLPTYSATGGPNGTPALVFNGTSDFLTMATAIPTGVTDLTMYAIFNPAGTPSSHDYDLISGSANNSMEFGIDPSDHIFFNQMDIIGAGGALTFPVSTWYTEVVTFHNGTSTTQFYRTVGGALVPDGPATVQAMTFSAVTGNLGGETLTNNYFNGSIAEWGFLSGSTSTTGIAKWSSCHYGI